MGDIAFHVFGCLLLLMLVVLLLILMLMLMLMLLPLLLMLVLVFLVLGFSLQKLQNPPAWPGSQNPRPALKTPARLSKPSRPALKTLARNDPRRVPNSSQNCSKIGPKWVQNGVLDPSWRPLGYGSFLGGLILTPSWPLGALLDASGPKKN